MSAYEAVYMSSLEGQVSMGDVEVSPPTLPTPLWVHASCHMTHKSLVSFGSMLPYSSFNFKLFIS